MFHSHVVFLLLYFFFVVFLKKKKKKQNFIITKEENEEKKKNYKNWLQAIRLFETMVLDYAYNFRFLFKISK